MKQNGYAAPMVRLIVANWCMRHALLGIDGEAMVTRAYDAYGDEGANLAEDWLLNTDMNWIAELSPAWRKQVADWIAHGYDLAGCESLENCQVEKANQDWQI